MASEQDSSSAADLERGPEKKAAGGAEHHNVDTLKPISSVQPEKIADAAPQKVEEAVGPPTKASELAVEAQQASVDVGKLFLCITVVMAGFLSFLVGLQLMGDSFKAMAGTGASAMFGAVEDPIAGLMVGVIATVLVQSSSTSTSIVVAMVSSEAIEVRNAIPIIMGANIGTSVTSTIVSMAQSGNRIDLERSFAGATVHDMFNFLTVLTLLPIEWIGSIIQGTGGPLYWFTYELTEFLLQGQKGAGKFQSPTKAMTAPITRIFLKSNTNVIYAQTLERPVAQTPVSICAGVCKPIDGIASVNCSSVRRLSDGAGEAFSQALMSKRRMEETEEALTDIVCGEYACVDANLAKYYKKISKSAYAKLVKCEDALPGAQLCGRDSCYLGGSTYYDDHVTNGRIISKGILEPAGDEAGGVVGVIIALFFMTVGLIVMCRSLQVLFLTQAKKVIRYSAALNGYVAILVGCGITMIVQSSSVVTSALTPLCGMGVLPLKKMLPMTLGSNIGTTGTAVIAALVNFKFDGIQIALAHLFFNLIGILIWFPVPYLRRIPLAGAKLLGQYASYFRFVPILYILFAFLAVPGAFLCVALAFYSSVALGVVLALLLVAVVTVFEFWWWRGFGAGPGAYKILSQEARQEGRKELVQSQAALMGVTEEDYDRYENNLTWFGN